MKHVFQLILLLTLSVSMANGQTFTPPSFADADNNYRTYVNQVFGALEANRKSIIENRIKSLLKTAL